ncbi:MAG: nucleoside 2-deoxyribosyltransferase domain-containing protein [Erysipelotrichaceae bacterium]|nr:nucleoside 2-deoxyribosyltransferase domain-containing protein [Erysipelotrichaceae bacterium]
MKYNKTLITVIKTALCILMIITLSSCKSNESSEALPESVPDTVPVSNNEAKNNIGKKVYFAAPLFCEMEKDFNLKITHLLEEYGYEVFLPQRDGFLAVELEGLTEEELARTIFEKDYENVQNADIIFMIVDGRVPDEGACVELGIAYASGKRCYGLKSDARVIETNLEINPMISGCFIKMFVNYNGEQLIEELKQYLSENEL